MSCQLHDWESEKSFIHVQTDTLKGKAFTVCWLKLHPLTAKLLLNFLYQLWWLPNECVLSPKGIPFSLYDSYFHTHMCKKSKRPKWTTPHDTVHLVIYYLTPRQTKSKTSRGKTKDEQGSNCKVEKHWESIGVSLSD